MRTAAALVVAGLALGAGAQDAAVDVPANARVFEVASVRVAEHPGGQLTTPQGTQVTETGIPMMVLLQLAFEVERSQVVGPDWMDSSMYDVVAKLPEGISLTREQMKVPLQQLLTDRFGLKSHREVQQKQGYALVVAKGGAPKGGTIMFDSVRLPSATMKTVAAILSLAVKQPVVDKTGIDGDYELQLSFAPEGKESTLPSIFTAVQEQLGLKLEPQKVPVNILVVDHLEKVPTEN